MNSDVKNKKKPMIAFLLYIRREVFYFNYKNYMRIVKEIVSLY
jgi:hypothetical protein